MMSRQNRMVYTPINRGHKPTPSQESNTLSTMSEVSCTTTVSMESAGTEESQEAGRLEDFTEEREERMGWRSGSEETVDTVVAVAAASVREPDKRLLSRNSDYGSYCASPADLAATLPAQDSGEPHSPLLNTSEDSDSEASGKRGRHPLYPVKIDIPPPGGAEPGSRDTNIPGEWYKSLIALLFMGTGFLATTTSLVLTHERVPDVQPLPDIVLDNFTYRAWGLDVSEYLLSICLVSAVLLVLLHKHRLIILRRIWLMLGVLYYYRALTMFVTVLPKSDEQYFCQEKVDNVTVTDYVKRVITIISGGGLSMNDKHVFCGDYIFSGHTMTLTMAYLAIKQYSPRRFLILHWISFIAALCGVIFLLLARGHYTIDVILAYYVTSRIWWIYHTLAHNQQLKTRGEHNLLDNLCWWHIFRWFESQTNGPLPRRYNLPLPKIAKRTFMRVVRRFRSRNSSTRSLSQP